MVYGLTEPHWSKWTCNGEDSERSLINGSDSFIKETINTNMFYSSGCSDKLTGKTITTSPPSNKVVFRVI